MTASEGKKRGRPRGRPSKAQVAAENREGAAVPAGPTLIKKYSNRRLYDTRRSKHVTLEDLVEVLARGEDIQVLDATTGEDVTKRVMTQIILAEEENRHFSILPLDFLKKLIQYRDDSVREYFQKFLNTSLETYLQAQRTVGQRMEGLTGAMSAGLPPALLPGAGGILPAVDPARLAAAFPWLNALPGITFPGAPGTPPAPPPVPEPAPAREPDPAGDEIAELKRRLADLEQRYPKRKS